jgi:uncharacterized secreted repeat protein (TIGR03808 family)
MPKLYTTNSFLTFTNDTGTDTLQGAVNTAVSTKKPLHIAAGTYTFTGLTVTGAVKIYGTKGATILKPPAGATSAAIIRIESSPVGNRISDVTIEGLQLQGLDLPISGHVWNNPLGLITAKLVDRLAIRDCYITQSQNAGIQLTGSAGLVENNEFWSCRTGIYVYKGLGMVLEANYIRDSKDNGIVFDRFDAANPNTPSFEGAVVRANKIYTVDNATGGSGQFGNGVICTQSHGITLTGNIISNTNYSGIRLNACSTSVVSGNQIYNARETALFVESLGPDVDGYKGVTVSGNTIDFSGNGISIANPSNGARRVTVTGNTVSNLTIRQFDEWMSADRNPATRYTMRSYAVGIAAEGSDTLVEGNILENCAGLGMSLYSSGDWNPATQTRRTNASVVTLVANNIIKACPIGVGFTMNDVRGHANISGNAIVGSSNGAIVPVHKTDITGADNPNNLNLAMAGPWVRDVGSSDVGMASTPIGDRYSFDRNKVVPLNS